MNGILQWGYSVALCAVIITMVEAMLPEGSSKQYAKVGLGLVLLQQMMMPLMDLLHSL